MNDFFCSGGLPSGVGGPLGLRGLPCPGCGGCVVTVPAKTLPFAPATSVRTSFCPVWWITETDPFMSIRKIVPFPSLPA